MTARSISLRVQLICSWHDGGINLPNNDKSGVEENYFTNGYKLQLPT